MGDFKVIQPSEGLTYWYELASYAAPYVAVGSFLFNAISFFTENSTARAFEKVFRKLDEISGQISEMKQAIEQKLNDMVLKERTGEVLGIKESLEEYSRIMSPGILDNIVTDSAQTKRKIFSYLDDERTPLEFFHAYNSLACMLVPLRVACFCLYKPTQSQTRALVVAEINDLLSKVDPALRAADKIGQNRVKYEEKISVFDEGGAVKQTDFLVWVDKEVVYNDSFIPHQSDLAVTRRKARDKFDEMKAIKGKEVCKPLEDCYQECRSLLSRIAH